MRIKKLIREVELENGEIISDPIQVNKEIRNFYQNMYTSKINGNNSTSAYEHNQKIDSFTEGLNIPQLKVEEQESLEKDLTLEELKDALASFADKKSPGEDGFTKEFYQTFFDFIGKDQLNSYNDSFHKGSLSIPLENKHYKNNLRHKLFGTERGFIELTISTEEEEQEN